MYTYTHIHIDICVCVCVCVYYIHIYLYIQYRCGYGSWRGPRTCHCLWFIRSTYTASLSIWQTFYNSVPQFIIIVFLNSFAVPTPRVYLSGRHSSDVVCVCVCVRVCVCACVCEWVCVCVCVCVCACVIIYYIILYYIILYQIILYTKTHICTELTRANKSRPRQIRSLPAVCLNLEPWTLNPKP